MEAAAAEARERELQELESQLAQIDGLDIKNVQFKQASDVQAADLEQLTDQPRKEATAKTLQSKSKSSATDHVQNQSPRWLLWLQQSTKSKQPRRKRWLRSVNESSSSS